MKNRSSYEHDQGIMAISKQNGEVINYGKIVSVRGSVFVIHTGYHLKNSFYFLLITIPDTLSLEISKTTPAS